MEMSGFLDKIKEQEFYQQIQSSYQQLPPEQQEYVKWGTVGAGFLILFYLIFSVIHSANGARSEYFEKQELARVINDASDEIRRLKGQNMSMSQSSDQTWKAHLSGVAASQGLPADSVEVIKESPGASQNVIQESLLEVKIKGAQVRPLVQILSQLDHGTPPMKLKGLQIESGTEGLLNAKLNLSGYMAKPEKGDKK